MGNYAAVVIGTSAGGSAALAQILPVFPANYPLPLIVVQHLHPWQKGPAVVYYARKCALTLKEADEKALVQPGHVYFAPSNYHLLIEADHTFSLSIDGKVNYTRPSIDVLFESAVDVYGAQLIGVILTGANADGAEGLRQIKAHGGLAIVQDPATAEVPYMPEAALRATPVDYVLSLLEIARVLVELGTGKSGPLQGR